MPDFNRLEPVDPQIFHMDWELTLKCNLDCGYCNSHDNSRKHPSLQECLDTVDFFLEYAEINFIDSILEKRTVVFNIFGGEAIYHPDIVTIYDYIKTQYQLKYKDKYDLTLGLITNAIASEKTWQKIVEYIDYFTVSYHTENNEKQEEQFRNNVLYLHNIGKKYHVAVLMNPQLFDKNLQFIEFCKEHSINYLPRQLDHWGWKTRKYNYSTEQAQWLDTVYKRKSTKPLPTIKIENVVSGIINKIKNFGSVDMTKVGRACCSGNKLCVNNKFDEDIFFVPDNRFENWHCSVNRFFLFVKQDDQTIYHNKDCKMKFDGKVGPMGYLKDRRAILDTMRTEITNGTRPVMICKKKMCFCGLCAPKAQDKVTYDTMLSRYFKSMKP